MQYKVQISGVDTTQLKVLKNEEVEELLVRVQNGDMEAVNRLVEGNLRLVLSVVQRFSGRGENPDDLFQVGCIGLIKGIKNFNISYGVRLSTYTVPMIIGEIRRFLRDSGSIRVSRSLRDTAYKVLQAKEQYVCAHQKEPTLDELARLLELKREEIALALDAITEPVSLYEPVYSDSGDTVCVMDQVRDPKNTDDRWLEQIALRQAFGHLSPREKHILTRRFYQGKTQMEVSKEIGISQAQVSRLEKGALRQMRNEM